MFWKDLSSYICFRRTSLVCLDRSASTDTIFSLDLYLKELFKKIILFFTKKMDENPEATLAEYRKNLADVEKGVARNFSSLSSILLK